MPLLSMARKGKATTDKDKPLPDPDTAADSSSEDRDPKKRLGTTGTELDLVSKTREASANYKRAQQAEKAYKFKKRAAGAKEKRRSIFAHFKQSAHHFKEGVKAIFSSIGAIPAIMQASKYDRQAKADVKKRERDIEKRKKLDERLRDMQLSEAEKETEKDAEK